jgi:hypothetical protein
MSEAITKACETCAGVGRPITFWNGTVDCVDCSGTGRVPDEVATLRAQLDAARAEVERLKADVTSLDALARGERAMVDAANDVIADLRAKISECAAIGLEAIRRLDERDAEVDRLTAREREATEWVRAAEFAAPLGSGAWGACPRCDRSKAQGHTEGCPIAAWLAGCAP